MGTNSADPDRLAAFATVGREADDRARQAAAGLRAAVDDFAVRSPWAELDASGLVVAIDRWLAANDEDARWTARIGETFRAAGAGRTLTLPDAAIEASLRSAHLDRDRVPLGDVDPVSFGAQPTSGYADDPVNTAIGNLVERETDLVVAGLPSRLTFVRTYNSRSDDGGPFGPGWSSWASARLVARPDGADYRGPDGQRTTFPRSGEGFGRVPGVRAAVERTGSGLALRWTGGERWEFDASGRPAVLSCGPGTEVRLAHDDRGRLVELAHAGGRRVALEWDGERITGLRSSDGRTAAYRYDARGHLVEADGVAGTRHYGVDDAGLLVSVTDADGVVELVNTYDEHGRVRTQRSPFGRTTTFSYLPGGVTVTSDDTGGPSNTFLHDASGRLVGAVDGHEQVQRTSYDDRGNPVAVVDRLGAVTVQEWDDADRLVRRTVPGGTTFTYVHDDADRLLSVSSSTGTTVRYTYSGAERTPSEIVDPEGATLRLGVSGGLVHDVTDADGVRTELRYDADGYLVGAVDADGHASSIERDAAGLPVAVTSPAGRRTTMRHDHRGMLVERTGPDGATWRYEHTAVGRPLAVTDPTGARTAFRHGDHGALEEVVDPLGGVTARRYDPLGNPVALTAPDGAKWTYVYDALSRVTASTDPAGATWLRDHDAEGNLVATTDPTGIRYSATVDEAGRVTGLDDGLTSSTFTHDGLGRTTAHVRPDGTALHATYDGCGRRLTETGPDGGTTRYAYTPGGRLHRVTRPSGRSESFEYDHCGRLARRVDGTGAAWTQAHDPDGLPTVRTGPGGERWTWEYDVAGRLVRRTAPGAGAERFGHDAAGRVVSVADRAGTRTFQRDAAGRLLAALDALGARTTYSLDAAGRTVAVVTPDGARWETAHDEVGRVVSETDPLGRTTRWTYDAAGHLTGRTDPTGATVRWSHDMSGRVRAVRAGGDAVTIDVDRDLLGRPVAVTETDARRIELGWDGAGRLVERRRGDLTLRWTYDEDGLCSALVGPDGSATARERDGAGRTVALTHPLLGRVRTERDASGRLVGVHGDGLDVTWRYDEGGALVAHERRHGGSVRRTGITRDADGRVAAVDVDGAVTTYTHDAGGRLVAASGVDGDRTFVYDACGRLAAESGVRERTYTYDAAGQLRTAGPTEFTYDRAGRRVRETGPDGERTLRHDDLGRLTEVRTTAADGSGRTTPVRVDALGELAEVGGVPLLWDSADPVPAPVWIGQSAVVGDGRPLAVVDAASRAAGGAPWLDTDRPTADPWGSAGDELGIGYRGEVAFDGLVWLRARAYDPDTRAFLSPDPLPPVPGTPYAGNPYHYAGDDPVTLVDPLGLSPLSDADMRAHRDQLGHGAWNDATDWWNDNWEYVAAGAAVVAGVALIATGAGSPAGIALIGAASGALIGGGASIGVQKYQNGEVDWGRVGQDTLVGGVGGLVGGGAAVAAARMGGTGAAVVSGAAGNVAAGATGRGLSGQDVLDPRGMATDLLVGGGTGAVAGRLGGVERSLPGQAVHPGDIRFSQSSVNDAAKIINSMKTHGWRGDPIDVVRMPDGHLTTVDNTRVVAARHAGIDTRATVHDAADPLPVDQVERFTTRRGGTPETWGDAVHNRIGNQNAGFRSAHPDGSPLTGWDGG